MLQHFFVANVHRFLCREGTSLVRGLSVNYSDPDEERHELQLMITQNVSARQASDWLTTFHKVMC